MKATDLATLTAVAIAAMWVVGCAAQPATGPGNPATPTAKSMSTAAPGNDAYAHNCQQCHGANLEGGEEVGAGLDGSEPLRRFDYPGSGEVAGGREAGRGVGRSTVLHTSLVEFHCNQDASFEPGVSWG